MTVVAPALRQGTLASHHLATTYRGVPDAHVEDGRLFAPARALGVATRRDGQALITQGVDLRLAGSDVWLESWFARVV